MKYRVTSMAINCLLKSFVVFPDGKRTRTEIIDTEANELFHGCQNEWDVADQYEAFWNRLNEIDCYSAPHWTHNPQGRVVVVGVQAVDVEVTTL